MRHHRHFIFIFVAVDVLKKGHILYTLLFWKSHPICIGNLGSNAFSDPCWYILNQDSCHKIKC